MQSPAHSVDELVTAALWRFAHLMLARAPGAHDAAARAAALRLALCDEVPLDALRAIAEAFHAALAARQLRPRAPGLRERALRKLPLPSLRGAGGEGEGPAADDRRRLARDTFYALGALALTAPDVGAAAAACAAAVLDSPAAAAAEGEREVVAESLRRLADALRAQYDATLRDTQAEAEEAGRRAERARARAASGRKPVAAAAATPAAAVAGEVQLREAVAADTPAAQRSEAATRA